MTRLCEEDEKETHAKIGYRIWMDQEYDILTKKDLAELKQYWDNK